MSVTSKTGPCPICQTSVEVIEDLTEYRRVFSCHICLFGIQWLPAK